MTTPCNRESLFTIVRDHINDDDRKQIYDTIVLNCARVVYNSVPYKVHSIRNPALWDRMRREHEQYEEYGYAGDMMSEYHSMVSESLHELKVLGVPSNVCRRLFEGINNGDLLSIKL